MYTEITFSCYTLTRTEKTILFTDELNPYFVCKFLPGRDFHGTGSSASEGNHLQRPETREHNAQQQW